MKATDLLEKQHRVVETIFERLSGDDKKMGKRELVEELANNLAAHQTIEEQIFYPAVKKALDEEGRMQVLEAFEEHALAKVALMRLLATAIDEEPFQARVTALKELIEHHVDEEEEDLFPEVEEVIDAAELTAMGAKMKALFEETMAKGYAAVMSEDPLLKKVTKPAKANGVKHERGADRR
jgi:hemerythrin superfamily protein